MTGRRFDGLSGLVTGGGGGIGRAIATRLAAEGAAVTVADLDVSGARATVATIAADGGQAVAEGVDLVDRRARGELVDRVLARWGRLDVLVNNAAAYGPRSSFLDLDDDTWDLVIETNLTATAGLSRAAARHMAGRDGGSIINVVSVQERLPLPTFAAYAASKGGISALTRALAVELSPLGVRVNAVAPGVIGTASLWDSPGGSSIGETASPPATLLGRLGRPGEVASVVAFLASADASFMTGAIVPVDGGRRLSRRPDPLAEPLTDRPEAQPGGEAG